MCVCDVGARVETCRYCRYVGKTHTWTHACALLLLPACLSLCVFPYIHTPRGDSVGGVQKARSYAPASRSKSRTLASFTILAVCANIFPPEHATRCCGGARALCGSSAAGIFDGGAACGLGRGGGL